MGMGLMFTIIAAALVIGGVGAETLEAGGVKRGNALFLLLSIAALSGFRLHVSDRFAVSPAALLAGAALIAFAVKRGGRASLAPPFAALAGMALQILPIPLPGALTPVCAALCAASAFGGAPFSMTFAALTPIFALAARYVAEAALTGYAFLDLTDSALSAQMAGMIVGACLSIAFSRSRTTVRKLSDDRTNN